MNANRASLEVIAPSVDEAIQKGLVELGLPEDGVEIEVLDAGSRGLFGLGLRQARVRLTIKDPTAQAEFETPSVVPTMAEELPEPEVEPAAPPAPVVVEAAAAEKPAAPQIAVEPDPEVLQVARETVEELLEKMHVQARVTARYAELEDERDRPSVLVDVRGDDLSILIGPKAETLNALQYITSLIVGKEIGHAAPLIVDVEGYRARRANQIRQVARRMAEQAVRTGRRQSLEPMPASERRLVHIELRDHPQVTTESIGEEPRRKVTIIPK